MPSHGPCQASLRGTLRGSRRTCDTSKLLRRVGKKVDLSRPFCSPAWGTYAIAFGHTAVRKEASSSRASFSLAHPAATPAPLSPAAATRRRSEPPRVPHTRTPLSGVRVRRCHLAPSLSRFPGVCKFARFVQRLPNSVVAAVRLPGGLRRGVGLAFAPGDEMVEHHIGGPLFGGPL